MNVSEIKARVMLQTNNDTDDVGDFEPILLDYINEGYDKMLTDAIGVHVGDTDYPLLTSDTDEPATAIPVWAHGALADYATYRIYMNGSSSKQTRAYSYLSNFNRAKTSLVVGLSHTITNIPT